MCISWERSTHFFCLLPFDMDIMRTFDKKNMDREFKSKVGWWYHLVLLIMAIVTIKLFVSGGHVAAMVIMLLCTMVFIHMLLNTWYRITADGYLVAHCSFFPEKRIAIAEITGVGLSSIPVWSYALSFDRLIIMKGEQQWLMISPRNKQEFVNLLRKINPNIKIIKSNWT